MIRIERRDVGEREHLARRRVEDDRGAGAGARVADAALERPLRGVLDRKVDRQLDGRPFHLLRLLDAVGRDLAAARVALDLEPARLGPEIALVVALDSFEALEVDAREADDVGRSRLVRVEPARLRDLADAVE